MNNEKDQNNYLEDNNLQLNDANLSEESFVDFIDENFESIKIAGCTRVTAFAWVCK